jgi:large subunit ribosomal protein L22
MQAQANNVRISHKHAMVLCRELRGMKLARAEKFLQNMLDQKESIEGKFYTNASRTILGLLKSAEANARQKNKDVEKLVVKNIKSDLGYKFIRPKSRFKFRGRKAKVSNITVVLGE